MLSIEVLPKLIFGVDSPVFGKARFCFKSSPTANFNGSSGHDASSKHRSFLCQDPPVIGPASGHRPYSLIQAMPFALW
jgi:hypothetical protein